MEIELVVDKYVLSANVVETDESFDHEFGTKKQRGLELKDFKIMSYNDSLEHDVTSAYIGSRIYDYYFEKLFKYAGEVYEVA